ncbi:MAG: sigma 54-interacting transcriptional regulator [Minicystis sp.]
MPKSNSLDPGLLGENLGRLSPTTPKHEAEEPSFPRLEIVLEQEAGQPSQRRMVVENDFFRIGSHPSNNLVLTDVLVSRFHCSLVRTKDVWRISDSGSLNGTRVSWAAAPSPAAAIRVREADLPLPECRIEIGQSVIRVRELGQVSPSPVPLSLSFGDLYGTSVPMRRLYELLKRVAKSDADVLIEGESGTGKELIATELVRRSARAQKPLVIVDCGAISPNLIESELFGHERGAFTGAMRDRAGAFESADSGTVFLDEIGELPLDMQPKLLRALAAREVRRIGDSKQRKIDVRVIAATNRKLDREVNAARFREDLYYRLSVVTIRVPPLRERLDDIPLLVNSFLSALEAMDKLHLFTPDVLTEMSRSEWPGNVRELRNYVERKVVLEGEGALSGLDDEPRSAPSPEQAVAVDLDLPFKDAKDKVIGTFERAYLTALLAWADGNVSRAARKANLDRMYLHRLLQRHGLRKSSTLEE